ncbi:hypothetical protein ACFL0H_03230 [Thermodesulfobacteriota bacterium]
MKRKWGMAIIIGLLLIMGGTLTVQYSGILHNDVTIGLPEGYEEPPGRVEKLKIEGSVSKYYDENLDLVAFGPGSGWLKFKTRDGISPVLSFKRVTQKDVQNFNRFSSRLGLPIRVKFSDNVLRLSALRVGDDPIHVADITEKKIGANSIMNKGFFPKEEPSRLVLRKDRSGKVFLVKANTPQRGPGVAPEQEEVVIAQKDKDVAAE